jgi:hypothetical protein
MLHEGGMHCLNSYPSMTLDVECGLFESLTHRMSLVSSSVPVDGRLVFIYDEVSFFSCASDVEHLIDTK